MAGGGAVGCESALHLAQQGRNVAILEMLPEIATDLPSFGKDQSMMQLEEKGVEIYTDCRIIGINDDGVSAVDATHALVAIPADRVILAMGLASDARLYEEMRDKIPEVYVIGDCVQPRRVGEATHDGYRVGCNL